MAKLQLTKWDPVDSLETEEDMLLYLEIAMEDPFPELMAAVLGDIARAKGSRHISEVSFDDARLKQAVEGALRLTPDAAPT